MTSNETIADIVREMFEYPKSWGEYNHLDWKALANRILSAHKREIAELHECLKVAEDALEKIDNMCDGDICKFFDNTHHCSACRYLDECQTGVAHAALAEIRMKGGNNGK